jgi:hypothetical protein
MLDINRLCIITLEALAETATLLGGPLAWGLAPQRDPRMAVREGAARRAAR